MVEAGWQPPVPVPVWHPLLRTASLLRLGRQQAEDLICLAEALQTEIPEPCTPLETCALLAADLGQCQIELEIFRDSPRLEGDFYDHLREARGCLERAGVEMWLLGGGEIKPDDSRNPVRAEARLRITAQYHAALGRLGSLAVEAFEEGNPHPRLMEDASWAAAVGTLCDLDYLVRALRDSARDFAGHLSQRLRHWSAALERQVEILLLSLPTEEDSAAWEATQELLVPGRREEPGK